MNICRVIYEALLFSAIFVAGVYSAWDDGWTERICGALLTLGWLVMNGGSPMGWMSIFIMSSIREEHWVRYGTFMVSTFGDMYEGYSGWMLGFVGYMIFLFVYNAHGFMMLPFDVLASFKEIGRPFKLQAGVHMAGNHTSKLVCTLLVNAFVTLLYLWCMTAQSLWSRGSRGMRMDMLTLPSKQEQVCCFLGGLAWNELMFYWSHRLLHHPKLYGKFHKKHHEYSAPFALAAIYCTPLEMIVSNLWPFLGVVSVFRFHLFFAYCWVGNAVMGTQTHHSGHKWPWMTVLDHQPKFHDLHHKYFNCNYGNVDFFDRLCGTSRYDDMNPGDKRK